MSNAIADLVKTDDNILDKLNLQSKGKFVFK